MSQYFYDYWLYTGNQTFLDKQTLLFTLESAAFYEDYLYLGDDGRYMVNPSFSSETGPVNLPNKSNATVKPGGRQQTLFEMLRPRKFQ